jgi:long-chain acyl-CoA synthetase
VNQCFIYGDSLHSSLVGVIIVNDTILNWAHEIGFTDETIEGLVQSREFCNAVQKALEAFGKRHGLSTIESIKGCHLDTKPFTIENGLLTATGKLRVWETNVADRSGPPVQANSGSYLRQNSISINHHSR